MVPVDVALALGLSGEVLLEHRLLLQHGAFCDRQLLLGNRDGLFQLQRVGLKKRSLLCLNHVNLVYKHLRRSQQNPQGGRIRREAAIHASNIMPIDPETNKPTRIRMKPDGSRRVRVTVQSGTVLDATAKKSRKGDEEES